MIAGIDLGTTNSLIGVMDSGFPVLIADENGQRLTPSVVHYTPDGSVSVGRKAQPMRDSDPRRTVYSAKRLMGLRFDEVRETFAYPLAGSPGEAVRIAANDPPELPEEVAARILSKLKRDAETSLGTGVDRAVITVPAYFNDAQRNATRKAGELAGFKVERILSEPTAAALAYGLDRLSEKSKVAVYDLGGGTFDISVLELNEGLFEVLATDGDTHLGGDDLDSAIALRLGVSLHDAGQLKCAFDAVSPDRLAEIEAACLPVIERTRAHCKNVLRDAGVSADDLDEVILVGGATRLPLVRRFVAELFRQKPNISQHPDEAVAIGAVLQAGILDGTLRNVTLLDVTPLSLGIETFGGLMNTIIPRNTTIPVKRGEMFTNAVAGQREMRIRVLQGEREMAADNWTLGEVTAEFQAAPRGRARVGVQFEIDADGILHVLTRDVATGADHVLEIKSAVDVADEAVEKMVGESVENAFEDMTARQLAEMRIKADEMIPAVESGIALVGGELDPDDLERIQNLVRDVRGTLSENNLQKLKKLVTELDDATQDLALKLIESSMKTE